MKSIIISGKRKRAIARATLKQGTGKVRINRKLLDNFTPKLARMKIMEPLLIAGDVINKIDITVNVKGGGIISQADAARLVIAKSIVKWFNDSKLEEKYLTYDRQLLVADVRRKEPRKPNDSKARAKRQKSYR